MSSKNISEVEQIRKLYSMLKSDDLQDLMKGSNDRKSLLFLKNVANQIDETTFVDFVTGGERPPLKLSPQEMAQLSAGFSVNIDVGLIHVHMKFL